MGQSSPHAADDFCTSYLAIQLLVSEQLPKVSSAVEHLVGARCVSPLPNP